MHEPYTDRTDAMLSRRAVLRMAGSLVVVSAASSTPAAAIVTEGYGANGYGEAGYGTSDVYYIAE